MASITAVSVSPSRAEVASSSTSISGSPYNAQVLKSENAKAAYKRHSVTGTAKTKIAGGVQTSDGRYQMTDNSYTAWRVYGLQIKCNIHNI